MSENRDCYGNMFPDFDRLEHNRPLRGKAFSVLVQSKGIGVSGRSVEVDSEAWARCVACVRYRDCHDLSEARLLLYLALHNLT